MNATSEREQMWADKIGQSRLSAAVEAEEMNLFAVLKPQLFKDGNQWCVLYGENLQVGIAGFGDTPRLAILAFNREWDNKQQVANDTASLMQLSHQMGRDSLKNELIDWLTNGFEYENSTMTVHTVRETIQRFCRVV